MVRISHSIDIDAEAARVWSVVADLPGYAAWNPFIVNAEGSFGPERQLRLHMLLGTRTITFTPEVKEVDEGRRVRWLGRLWMPGIFDGEHVLEVETIGDRRSRFTQREEFRGVLVPFMRSLLGRTDEAFQAMNVALKARVEGAA
jgi:hypothetical protein